MTKIVNLRKARKQAARAEKRRAGAVAAARHGRSKAERAGDEAQEARRIARLDAHRRDPE